LARSRPADVRARISSRSKLGQPGQDRHHQAAVRIGGIGPTVGQALKRRAALADGMHDVEQVARAAR
jgi:hypothetical protein